MTNTKTTPDNMAEVLNQTLQDYAKEVMEDYGDVGREITELAVERLKETSPRNTGKYAKSWTYKEEKGFMGYPIYTIYNDKNYRLTHLLEYGHVIRDGTGRKVGEAGAKPHIKDVEEWVKEELPRMMEQKLGGK